MRGRSVRLAILVALLVGLPGVASAVDAVAVEGGTDTDDGIGRIGAAVQWDWQRQWFAEGDWFLGGYWEANVGYWWGDDGTTGNDSLVDLGFTPVFRLQPHGPMAFGLPFLEAGVGVHLFSENEIENEDFSINFSFGEFVGAGLRFGDRQQYEFGYRYQHLSNLGLGDENPGIDFHLLRLGYRF